MSLRFLGRRVYLGLVVALCSARHAGQNTAAATLYEALEVPLRTLQRWRRWWREDTTSRGARGRGFPEGQLGELLALMHELDHIKEPLIN